MAGSALSLALRHQRWVMLGALGALTVLCWGYILWPGVRMPATAAAAPVSMAGMNMTGTATAAGMAIMAPALAPWTGAHAWLILAMWGVMMVGMMTPAVAPMILIYMQVARQAAVHGGPFAPAGWLAAGYLAAWLLFAAVATLAQWGLEALGLLTPMMASASRRFGGAVLVAAGIYQCLPVKDACLSACRAPLAFVQRHGGFRPDALGSLRLGLRHGLYCVGCCWALMTLLFVGGVMNPAWIALLMIFVLLERLVPGGRYLARIAGLALFAAGLWVLAGP
jgi:predicted metal-binding membrane protein